MLYESRKTEQRAAFYPAWHGHVHGANGANGARLARCMHVHPGFVQCLKHGWLYSWLKMRYESTTMPWNNSASWQSYNAIRSAWVVKARTVIELCKAVLSTTLLSWCLTRTLSKRWLMSSTRKPVKRAFPVSLGLTNTCGGRWAAATRYVFDIPSSKI